MLIKNTDILQAPVKKLVFNGEPGNEMLAPRGVFMHNNTLVVSDTGKNRILIWKDFLFRDSQPCDVILGQAFNEGSGRNAGAAASAASLQYPSGIWTDGKKLIVADAWNHRVLIWHTMPAAHFSNADVVIGQKDFTGNQPNVWGIGKPPAANSLYWPYGVFSNGSELWIADTGNRRVLYFSNIPKSNFVAANKVIGQENFNERDYNNENAVWPYSVKVSADGALAIADTQYYRVLLWQNKTDAFHQKAHSIIGQENFSGNGQNQYRLKPAAHTLNWVYDCCFYRRGMAIADTGNSRIVLHNRIPEGNNGIAHTQLGQPDFETHGETSLSFSTSIQHEMYWPFAVNTCGDYLLVADTGNHRILFYKTAQ